MTHATATAPQVLDTLPLKCAAGLFAAYQQTACTASVKPAAQPAETGGTPVAATNGNGQAPSTWIGPALVPLRALLKRLQLSRSQIYALMARGEFPRPLKVGRSARWLSNELDDWIETRCTARSGQLVSEAGAAA